MARPRMTSPGFQGEVQAAYAEVNRYRVSALKSELHSLMTLAQQGALVYGRDEDVEQMVFGARLVLELRHPCREGGRLRQVRMYFSEPAHDEHTLLGLHVTVKLENDGTRAWKAAQNRDCAEAETRLREHYGLVIRPIER